MTYCKNCHKMSRDDDFCSHCGSAVWGEDYVSNDAAINCDSLSGHTHDKVTYDRTERGEGVHIPEGYKPYNPTPKKGDAAGNGKAVSTLIKIIITISIISSVIEAIVESID